MSGEDGILRMPAIVECPVCEHEQEVVFQAQAIDIEQLRDPPEADVACEECDHEWRATYPGFIQYGYA